MALSEYDKAHVSRILSGDGNWFTAKLLRLISVADTDNLSKLYQVYPDEVDVVYEYQHGVKFENRSVR